METGGRVQKQRKQNCESARTTTSGNLSYEKHDHFEFDVQHSACSRSNGIQRSGFSTAKGVSADMWDLEIVVGGRVQSRDASEAGIG